MRRRFCGVLAVWAAGVVMCSAQPPEPATLTPAPPDALAAPDSSPASSGGAPTAADVPPPTEVSAGERPSTLWGTQPASAFPYYFWAELDYLLFWEKSGPRTPPLLTTGQPTDPNPAVLGSPGTQVLVGNAKTDYGGLSGGRWRAGFWIEPSETLGVEVRGFALQESSPGQRFASDAAGNQIFGRPFQNAADGTELVDYASFPNEFAGFIHIGFDSAVWGIEANFPINLLKASLGASGRTQPWADFRVDAQAGFTHLSLLEDLDIESASLVLAGGGANFGSQFVGPGNRLVIEDNFRASNQFYGGHVGFRTEFYCDRCLLDLLAMLHLGTTQETVNIEGHTTLIQPDGTVQTLFGGLLATSTNSGTFTRDRFTAIPEVGVTLGFQATPLIRLTVGYTFLYWDSVVRPADQLDRVVNLTGVPDSGSYGPLTGPARPAAPNPPHETSFWTQGLNLGLVFKF